MHPVQLPSQSRTAEATMTDDAAGIASTRANFDKAKVDVLNKTRKLSRTKQLMVDGFGNTGRSGHCASHARIGGQATQLPI